MRFCKFIPAEQLSHFIKCYIIAENDIETEYKVLPQTGPVIGFQYSGQLAIIDQEVEIRLSSAGITGLSDKYRIFKNSVNIGTILVHFTEVGFTHFASHPASELFNLSVSLDHVFNKNSVRTTEERLCFAKTDQERIHIVESFLLSQLKDVQTDKLIIEAIKIIYQTKGTVRIKELSERLFISQSPFEKRFKKLTGTTPKKLSSIIRFNTVLDTLSNTKSLTRICYENNFFDQAHLIKDFKQYSGKTPGKFKRIF